jgi:hypothetical protein
VLEIHTPIVLEDAEAGPALAKVLKQAQESERQGLASGDRADDEQRFPALRNGGG